VFALGLFLLSRLGASPENFDIAWRMAVCGLGFGLFQSPNNRTLLTSAPRERSGSLGGVQSTARLLGQSVGAALAALVFGLAAGRPAAATSASVVLAAALAAVGAAASLLRLLPLRKS
jgi:MFS transporter, DHA2 family, multidrug resistance protein